MIVYYIGNTINLVSCFLACLIMWGPELLPASTHSFVISQQDSSGLLSLRSSEIT